MSTELARVPEATAIESALIGGDLSKLTPAARLSYYRQVCQSLGLNPLTKPFEYIVLNGRLTLYAKRDAADQLRKINGVSITIASREAVEGIYIVTARATDKTGRTDESTGAVPIEGLKGETRANAVMKAETKAKRRVTLSICGLGMLDETEVDSIPDAHHVDVVIEPEPRSLPPANGNGNGHKTADYLSAIEAASSKTELQAIATQIREAGIKSPELVAAWSKRNKEVPA